MRVPSASGLSRASVLASLLMRIEDSDVPRHELPKLPYVEPNRCALPDRNEWCPLMVYTGDLGPPGTGVGSALLSSRPANPTVESVRPLAAANFSDAFRSVHTNTSSAKPCAWRTEQDEKTNMV